MGGEKVKQLSASFGSTFSERTLTARDVSIHVSGDAAWVAFYRPNDVRSQRVSSAYWQTSVMQIDSRVRPMGGAGRPLAVISFRSSSPVSGCEIADCTPTRTRPSA